tara:strand:+ start:1431 stop:1562 length:132 start_codon:yes stop_codon:yes gene_type:complete
MAGNKAMIMAIFPVIFHFNNVIAAVAEYEALKTPEAKFVKGVD